MGHKPHLMGESPEKSYSYVFPNSGQFCVPTALSHIQPASSCTLLRLVCFKKKNLVSPKAEVMLLL